MATINFDALDTPAAPVEKPPTAEPQATAHAVQPPTPADTRGIGEKIFGADNAGDAAVDLVKGIASGGEKVLRGVRETGKILTGDTEPMPPPYIEDPKGMVGQFAQAITQFGIGWSGAGIGLKAVGLAAKLGKVGTTIASQGIGTGIVADAHAPNLANIIEQFPVMKNPILDYLSSKPEDSYAEGKFKAAIMDMGLQASMTLKRR